MIHLFDRIYLAHDNFLEGGSYIHISKLVYGELGATSRDPNAMFCGATVQEILGDKSFLDFFRILSNVDKKLFIYADKEGFADVLTVWLKSATNMDDIAFEKYIDMYLHKFNTFYGKPTSDFKTILLNAWANAPSFDVSSGVSLSRSYEFLLASALYNREFQYKPQLKAALLHFYKREYEHSLLEIKKDIDMYMFSDTVLSIFGENIDSVEELKASEKYNELFNRPMWKEFIPYDMVDNSGTYLPGSNSIVDISKATINDLENFFELYVKIKSSHDITSLFPLDLIDINYYKEQVIDICKEIILGEMTDETYNKILDRIVSNDMLLNAPTDLFQTILNLLVSHIKKLHKTNDARLFYYTLK